MAEYSCDAVRAELARRAAAAEADVAMHRNLLALLPYTVRVWKIPRIPRQRREAPAGVPVPLFSRHTRAGGHL